MTDYATETDPRL